MSVVELADQPCRPLDDRDALLDAGEIQRHLDALDGWGLNQESHLSKSYKFPDFVTALAFTNAIGSLAENVGHHPNLELGWGRVGVEIWTHDLGGLQLADFILAARIDRIPQS